MIVAVPVFFCCQKTIPIFNSGWAAAYYAKLLETVFRLHPWLPSDTLSRRQIYMPGWKDNVTHMRLHDNRHLCLDIRRSDSHHTLAHAKSSHHMSLEIDNRYSRVLHLRLQFADVHCIFREDLKIELFINTFRNIFHFWKYPNLVNQYRVDNLHIPKSNRVRISFPEKH